MNKVTEIMTSKNAKTLLFAGIIAAMILPFNMTNHTFAETFDGQIDTSNVNIFYTNSTGEDKLSIATGKEITTNYTVLNRAHSDVTNIMIDQSEKPLEIYDGPDIPIVMAYIDDDTLVIGLDPMAMYFDPPIEPELLQHILDIDEPVEIQYVSFEDEASASQTKSWQDKYKKSCMPVKSGYQNVCKVYKNVMKRLNISLPTSTTSSTTTSTTVTPTQTNTGSPCDTSARSTACYYYKQYEQKCTNGKTYKRCNTYATQIKSAGYALPGSSGTQTVTPTVTTPTYELNNVQAAKSGDNITLSWDAPTGFKVKYYKVYVTDNDRYYKYKGKINKSATSYTLSDVTEGKSYKFKIKLYYENTRGSTSVKYFYSNSVDVPRIVIDRIAPVITVPQDITVNSKKSTGKIVNYVVSAIDETDGRVSVQCSQASGTNFTPGNTKVICTATDKVGNKATVSFNILVEFLKSLGVLPTEFYGGNEYHLVINNAGKIEGTPSTLTIGVTTKDDVKGVIVSGHGASFKNKGETLVGHNIIVDSVRTRISNTAPQIQHGGNIDAAFVPITESNIVIGSKVQALDGTIIDVTQGSLSNVPLDAKVNIYGIHNNDDAQLVAKNATITTKGNKVYSNMGISMYNSIAGDSGAPIIYHDGDKAKIIGVHKGAICVFSVPSDNPVTHVNVTNTNWCHDVKNGLFIDSDIDRYKAFTAWENVRTEFNLQ